MIIMPSETFVDCFSIKRTGIIIGIALIGMVVIVCLICRVVRIVLVCIVIKL